MKKSLMHLCVLSALIYTLSHPFEISYYAATALKLCATAVIPSLFIFIVFSRLMTYMINNTVFSGKIPKLLSRIFMLPVPLLPICLFGLFCGAPSGAVGIANIYSSGLCTKDEAERAMILSNNCSAAFILSIAASSLSGTAGAVIILFSNILTTVLIYLLFFRNSDNSQGSIRCSESEEYSLSYMITDSISSAVNTVTSLCGYVVFFYSLSAVLSEKLWSFIITLTHNSNAAIFAKSAVSSLFEMTTGVLMSASLSGNIRILMISGAVAFCGMSILFQVMSIAGKYRLSCLKFVYSKIISAFISPLITLLLLFIIPTEVSVMNTYTLKTTGGFTSNDLISFILITCIFFFGAYLLSYLDKKHKN